MEILEILKNQGQNLYPEDLDFFETELATGGIYSDIYQIECNNLIKKLREWMSKGRTEQPESNEIQPNPERTLTGPCLNLSDILPQSNSVATFGMKPDEIILNDISSLRNHEDYKRLFKKYISQKPEIDEAFIDGYYSFFEKWEMEAILSVMPLSEVFLEKYFYVLNHEKLARYQQFSESFFMKHFTQLDANIVLEHGKNDWRKKENRSKQLDVFLRLKGVKI